MSAIAWADSADEGAVDMPRSVQFLPKLAKLSSVYVYEYLYLYIWMLRCN